MGSKMPSGMKLETTAALTIFALTYLVLAVGKLPFLRLDRPGAALVGGVAMVASGVLSGRGAESAVDFPTLGLLLGMMIVVANLRVSGAFALVARKILGRAASGYGLLAIAVVLSGVLAAFFTNDVVCLVLAAPLIEAAASMHLDPIPVLLALATASNIGSAATITGNPQNMIVAGFAHLGYVGFAASLAPAAVAGLMIDYSVIAWLFRRRLHGHKLHDRPPARPPRVLRPLMVKASVITLGTLVCFLLGFPTHIVALSAGALLMVTRRIRAERIYREIDWTMLLMFAGLFVVVAGAETSGFQNYLLKLVGIERLTNPTTLALVSTALSNLVSNVPAVMLFRPLYPILGHGRRVALVLASSSTFAGNLTPLGSIANMIVIEQARRRGIHISFSDYFRVGLPVTLLTLAVDIAILRAIA